MLEIMQQLIEESDVISQEILDLIFSQLLPKAQVTTTHTEYVWSQQKKEEISPRLCSKIFQKENVYAYRLAADLIHITSGTIKGSVNNVCLFHCSLLLLFPLMIFVKTSYYDFSALFLRSHGWRH